MIISSAEDGVYIDMQRKQEIDLDDKFNIGCIKEIIHDGDDKVFYILANKYDEKLGFFLIKMSESDTNNFIFLTKYKNKLDIGDATVSVARDEERGYKEVVFQIDGQPDSHNSRIALLVGILLFTPVRSKLNIHIYCDTGVDIGTFFTVAPCRLHCRRDM